MYLVLTLLFCEFFEVNLIFYFVHVFGDYWNSKLAATELWKGQFCWCKMHFETAIQLGPVVMSAHAFPKSHIFTDF